MKRTVLIALALAASVAAFFFLRTMRAADTNGALTASGTVEVTEARLGFPMAGRIAEIKFIEGSGVKTGDVLAVIDSREIAKQVDLAQAKLHEAEIALEELRAGARAEEIGQARAALEAVDAELAKAKVDFDRAKGLKASGAISDERYDAAESAVNLLEAKRKSASEHLALIEAGARDEDIKAAGYRVEQARAALAASEEHMRNAVIRAPFDGVVLVKYAEPGEVMAAGSPVLSLGDLSRPWVKIYVKEDRLGHVRLGQDAEVTVDSWPGRTFKGTVTFISSEAEFTPKNVQTKEDRVKLVFGVKVSVTGEASLLKPGMPADVRLLP